MKRADRSDPGAAAMTDRHPARPEAGVSVISRRVDEVAPSTAHADVVPAARRRTGPTRRVTIVGGGPAGLLGAIYLARRGCAVNVFEMRHDPRTSALQGGRSINLTLAMRALDGLGRVGLRDEVLAMCVPLRSRIVHQTDASVVVMPYGVRPHEVLHSVGRADLTRFLTEAAAAEPNVYLHFEQRCAAVDVETATATFVDPTGAESVARADLLIGADGVNSIVREHIVKKATFVDYQQHFVDWRYKELSICTDPPGSVEIDLHGLHVWPRGEFMMFALPSRVGVNAVCVLPAQGPNSFAAFRTPSDVRDFFNRHFPDVTPHMPRLVDEVLGGRESAFPTIRTSSWHHADKVVLIGDACHAVIPFLGQGLNASFEDCVTLDQCLAEHWLDRGTALTEYQRRRRTHTDTLADLSIANFAELRDATRDPWLAARKEVRRLAYRTLGEPAAPLYSLVAHSTIPYRDCVRISERRDRVAKLLGADLAASALVAWNTARRRLCSITHERMARSMANGLDRKPDMSPLNGALDSLAPAVSTRTAGSGGARWGSCKRHETSGRSSSRE